MHLRKLDVYGYKGIQSLSFNFHSNSSVLIGENRWGRSSLIDALMLLSFDNLFYQFVDTDFYRNGVYNGGKLDIRFTYAEVVNDELCQEHCSKLNAVKYLSSADNELNCITYAITAEKQQNLIITTRQFLDEAGNPIVVDNTDSLVQLLISLHPVIRLKNPVNPDDIPITNQPLYYHYIEELLSQMTVHSEHMSKEDLQRGLDAAASLLEYYFADHQRRHRYKNIDKKLSTTTQDWYHLDKINRILDELNNDYLRATLFSLFSSFMLVAQNDHFNTHTLPILLLEEPESRLHPVLMAVGFRLLKNFPTQKIITTNSSDLIALFSLENLYHLIRKSKGIVVMSLGERGLAAGDARRIMFHVLYRRPSALFARCWLLVEGETEVWLLRELAEQSGYSLNSEGVQLIEFAQCGLRPLIKYANKMGISWHVLTDGDAAGKKYAETARSMCLEQQNPEQYVTILPGRDIENFLFKNGFSHVYKMAAYGFIKPMDIPVQRIIQKAINRTSKPDLAIAICDDARKRGVTAIPELLQHTFSKVIKRANKFYLID